MGKKLQLPNTRPRRAEGQASPPGFSPAAWVGWPGLGARAGSPPGLAGVGMLYLRNFRWPRPSAKAWGPRRLEGKHDHLLRARARASAARARCPARGATPAAPGGG